MVRPLDETIGHRRRPIERISVVAARRALNLDDRKVESVGMRQVYGSRILAFLLVAAVVAVLSWGRLETTPRPPPVDLPERPNDHPQFLNLSSIREWDPEALFQLERARELTGIEFVMVFLPSIAERYTTERFAAQLFEAWRIGDETAGKGVLFLFVEDRHTLKIEVGYSLEGTFPDAFCAGFQEYIQTYFAGQYFGDVVAHLVISMVERHRGEEVEAPRAGLPIDQAIRKAYLSGGAGITSSDYYYEKERKLAAIRAMTPGQRRDLVAGTPEETIERFLLSLEMGINSPELDLLNEGSRMMRLEYPHPASSLRGEARKYRAAPGPMLHFDGGLAVARFGDAYVLPIFLRLEPDGAWRIDLVKASAYMTGDRSMTRFYPLFTDHPFMFAYPEYVRGRSRIPIPELRDLSTSLATRIRQLEARLASEPNNAEIHFELASIFYFECYWIRAAINAVERGLALRPDRIAERWLAIEMRYRFPATGGASVHYDQLRRLFPKDRDLWEEAIHHERKVIRDPVRGREIELELARNLLTHRARRAVAGPS